MLETGKRTGGALLSGGNVPRRWNFDRRQTEIDAVGVFAACTSWWRTWRSRPQPGIDGEASQGEERSPGGDADEPVRNVTFCAATSQRLT